ncbi:EpsG family protein [Limosilactobacillus oris]|uniref:EpsG family protein n=1 Tax=Limosilactobacillus oris TaxID=1632 RepID=UPI001883F84C|nr:EpsG family protein [Limosilactobacillus oris]MBF0601918.1 EpsG family protein [Limosilactobacillus oris]
MLIYIILLMAIFVYALLLRVKPESKSLRKLFLFLSFGSCALVLGLRAYFVGEDTASYITIFNFTKSIPLCDILTNPSIKIPYFVDYNSSASVESGFLLWCKFIQILSNNPQVFLFLTASLTCFLFAKFIYDNCEENVFFPTIVFLCESIFMNSFNIARQMLACAIAIQAYSLLKNNKYWKAILIILIAFAVHHTAIITIILIPLFWFFNNHKRNYFNYIAIIISLVPIILAEMPNLVGSIFSGYSSYYVNRGSQNLIGLGTIVFIVIELVGIIYMHHNEFKIDGSSRISLLIILSIAFELAGLKVAMFLRMALYFRAYLLLFFNKLFKTINPRYRFIFQLCILFLLILFYLSYANTPARKYSFFM